jgi:hypothetical protein
MAFTGAITLQEAARSGSLTRIDQLLYDRFSIDNGGRDGLPTFYSVFPFEDTPGSLSYKFRRTLALPNVAPRNMNENVAADTKGQIEEVVEAFKIYETSTVIDVALLATDAGRQHMVEQSGLHFTALLQIYLTHVFKGDESSTPAQVTGFQARLTGGQLIEAGSTNGGDACSVAKVRQLIDAVNGPNKVLFMSKGMSRRADAAVSLAGVGGQVQIGVDTWAGKATAINGVPIVPVADFDGNDSILAFDEVGAGGATATAGSIYCVSLGGKGVTGQRNGLAAPRQVGEVGLESSMRNKLLGLFGLALKTPKCAARLRGISDAAWVA